MIIDYDLCKLLIYHANYMTILWSDDMTCGCTNVQLFIANEHMLVWNKNNILTIILYFCIGKVGLFVHFINIYEQ